MSEILPPNRWVKLEALFLAAVERPEAERASFLKRECGGDQELLVAALSLLEHDAETPADDAALLDSVRMSAASALDDSPPGLMLGVYRIERELGRGGTGAVFLAVRSDLPGSKRVAIKLIKRGMDTAEVLQRFRHERQILAGLEHPYIVRFIDAGSSADGRPFLVMELVEGQPIDEYCRKHHARVEERCRLFLKACEAVAYAHRKLVVHRDLKPRNILIDGEGCPKLLDFGLGKILDRENGAGLTITGTRGRPFTPEYASPEQIRGLTLNTATDIYSLGAILYELLAGVRPHRLESGSPVEWEHGICDHELTPPSAAATGARPRRQLEGDLDNIVMMAMRKEPDRRYPSVDEFAADIRRYLESRPVAARKDSLWYRIAKFIRRRRLTLLASGAVAASILTGMVLALSQAREAERARLRAEDRLTQVAILSDRSLSGVYTLMERLPGSIPARKTLIATTLGFLEKLSKEAGGNVQLRIALAKAYLRLGDLQGDPDAANMGDKEDSLASYRAGLALLDGMALSRAAGHEALVVWLGLRHKTASLLRERGQEKQSAKLLLETLGIIYGLPPADAGQLDIQRLKGLLLITLARAEHPDYHASEPYATEAVNTFDGLVGQYPGDADLEYGLSMAHTELGYVLLYLGRLPDAAAHYEKSTELRERLVKEHPGDALFRRSLMLAYDHYATLMDRHRWPGLGRPEVARVYARKALAIAEATASDPDNTVAAADYATMLLDLGTLEVARDRLPDSLAGLRHAASIFESLRAGDKHFDGRLAFTYEFIARRLEAMGRKEEALAGYRRAAAVAAGFLPAYPSDGEALHAKAGATEGIARLTARSAGGVLQGGDGGHSKQ